MVPFPIHHTYIHMKKKQTAKQINLFEWANPAPSDSHPVARAFQPEWRFGATVAAGAVMNLVLRDLIGIKLPAINPELVRGMELQVKLQEERGLDVVEFEAWMEEEKRCIRTGFTTAAFYSTEEWFVLTGREDGGLCADDLQSEEEEEIKLLKREGDYLADLDEEAGDEPF